MRGDKLYLEGGSLPLASKVAATRQHFSATPSTGVTPATPQKNFLAEVRV